MTLSTTINKTVDVGDGASVDFEYTYKLLNELHLVVYVDGVIQTLGVNYTVDPADIGLDAGTMTFTVAPAVDAQIILLRIVPYTQLTDYVENDKFPSQTHEATLDLITMEIQQLNEQMGRAIQVDVTQTGFNNLLPAPVAGMFIRWRSDLLGFENAGLPSGEIAITSYMEAMLACSDIQCVSDFIERHDNGGCYVRTTGATSIALSQQTMWNGGGSSQRILVKNGSVWQSRVVPTVHTYNTAGFGLAGNAQYWAYLYYDAAAGASNFLSMAVSTSQSGVLNSEIGIKTKADDITRTLVAMFKTDAGALLDDTETVRHFISYYNRKPKQFRREVTTDRATASASWVESHTDDRVFFLIWADTTGAGGIFPGGPYLNATASNDTAGGVTEVALGFNGNVTVLGQVAGTSPVGADVWPVGIMGTAGYGWTSIVEGAHFISPLIRLASGAGANLENATFDLTIGGHILG